MKIKKKLMKKKKPTKTMNKIILFFCAIFISIFLFSGCTLSESDQKDALKILEIREDLINKGKTNSLAVILSDDFPNRKEFLNQEKYRNFYFTEYDYRINSIKFTSYNPLTKKASALINYDLIFKVHEDPAPAVLLGRNENVTLVKEKIGWKIADIKEVAESGRKISPQTVHDIFYPLDARKTAISNGDYALFESVIHQDFPARSDLLEDFRKNTEVFSEINYGLKGRELSNLSSDGTNAEVIQYFDLFFKTKEGNVSEKIENQKEAISLKKTADGTWKIIGGLR